MHIIFIFICQKYQNLFVHLEFRARQICLKKFGSQCIVIVILVLFGCFNFFITEMTVSQSLFHVAAFTDRIRRNDTSDVFN